MACYIPPLMCYLVHCEKIQQQLYVKTAVFANDWGIWFFRRNAFCVLCVCGLCTYIHVPVGICLCISLNAWLCVCVYARPRVSLILVGQNELRNTEMLSAACAVGVGCCFAAPIGGKTTWLQPRVVGRRDRIHPASANLNRSII